MKPNKTASEFVGNVLRSPDRMSAGDLVAAELMSAMVGDPLSKIRHVCEAVMFLEDEERKVAKIDDAEMDEVRKLYALAITLQNAYIERYVDNAGRMIDRCAVVPWPFAREEAEKWLEWAADIECKYFSEGPQDDKDTNSKLEKLTNPLERKYEVTQNRTTIDSLNKLKTKFTMYAMPQAAVLMKKTICYITPENFRQILEHLRRK